MAQAQAPQRVTSMVDTLRRWQAIERKSMELTAQIMERTKNPFVRMIMEIVRHDSLMHHRVQQLVVDTLTEEDVPLDHAELGEIWRAIEAHDEAEKEVVFMGETLREQAWNPIHKMLLDYLVSDEKKHDRLLEQLGEVKRGMARATQ